MKMFCIQMSTIERTSRLRIPEFASEDLGGVRADHKQVRLESESLGVGLRGGLWPRFSSMCLNGFHKDSDRRANCRWLGKSNIKQIAVAGTAN